MALLSVGTCRREGFAGHGVSEPQAVGRGWDSVHWATSQHPELYVVVTKSLGGKKSGD